MNEESNGIGVTMADRRHSQVYMTIVMEDACEGGGKAEDIGETWFPCAPNVAPPVSEVA